MPRHLELSVVKGEYHLPRSPRARLVPGLRAGAGGPAWASCRTVLSCRPSAGREVRRCTSSLPPGDSAPSPSTKGLLPLPVPPASYLGTCKVSSSTCPDARSWRPQGPGSARCWDGHSGPALGPPIHLRADHPGAHLPLHAVLHPTSEYLLPRQPGHQFAITVPLIIHAKAGGRGGTPLSGGPLPHWC